MKEMCIPLEEGMMHLAVACTGADHYQLTFSVITIVNTESNHTGGIFISQD